ncbi:MAG: aminopeptidase P family N-terminal domain-containing protein [Rickettsiales bacterium]|nr:aminopeptidase P family N-terminal domain-containing protein [Rickettsiales bacterium]
MSQNKIITRIRKTFSELNISGYIIPSNDEFMSEYVPEHSKRLEYVTGFTGSAGVAVILEKKAAFFTDGRYTLQAKQQLNVRDFKIFNIADKSPIEWLLEQQDDHEDMVIGFDPWLHTVEKVKNIRMKAFICEPLNQTRLMLAGRIGPSLHYSPSLPMISNIVGNRVKINVSSSPIC